MLERAVKEAQRSSEALPRERPVPVRAVDKCHHGVRICVRLRPTILEQAVLRLRREVARVDLELARRAHARPLFRDCAARAMPTGPRG